MSNNLKRGISGTIYILLILISIYKGFFNFLLLGFSFLCIQEFLIFSATKNLVSLNLILFFAFILLEFFFKENNLYKIICLIGFSSIFFIKTLFSCFSNQEKIRQLSNLFFAWVYILLPALLANYMYLNKGNKLIFYLFILIWTNDTFSYLIGKKWGKKKIVPHISPVKTLEGYLAGIFFSLIAGIVFYLAWKETRWIIFGPFVALLASLGDLLESIIKRAYKVKDSGSGFPGHGGFLDRLDSFIFSVPIVFIFYLIFKK